MNMPLEFDVFVSYSSKDKAIADAVVASIESEGIRCWYAPRDIAPGADWADSITKAIQECSMMVLVFSEKANRSQRVVDEINFAIDQRKPILPFRIEAYNPTGALSLHLSSRHWLDAYEPSWDVHLDRLVESVAANLGKKAESIQISGGAASATVVRRKDKGLPRTALYAVAGLVIVSLLGYFGWQKFGSQPAPAPSPVLSATVPLEGENTESTQVGATTEMPVQEEERDGVLSAVIPEGDTSLQLDPQLNTGARNQLALTLNMFLTLTKYDLEAAAVVPGAARSWTVSPDGMIYTFTLYPDIPWVTHELGGETTQVTDENGNPRFLKAEDFIYPIQRMCDPRIMEFYFRPTEIQGCQDALDYGEVEDIPQEVFDAIGVEAVSDTELILHLNEPSGAFLTKTNHFFFSALPNWAMDKYGEAWTNPGLIPSNGPFVIDDWIPGESIRLVRNELLPDELAGKGNLGSVELLVTDGDPEEEYQLWLSNQVDYVSLLDSEQYQEHFSNSPDETTEDDQVMAVSFLQFDLTRPPFDDVNLRRAFSAALDRESLANETQYAGSPMIHLAPPSAFGAPPIDEVGISYDPEYAQALLEEAGYPQCEGLPPVAFATILLRFDEYGENIARSWEEALGCPEGTIDYQGRIDYSERDTYDWQILATAWGADFPDEDNWVGTILSCEKPYIDRECSEIDDLIEQAREEYRPSERIQLYRQIEEDFFGPEGSFPIAPLSMNVNYYATRSWTDLDLSQYAVYRVIDWSETRIDMDGKAQALGD